MNSFSAIVLLLTANLLLVTSFSFQNRTVPRNLTLLLQNRTVFRKSDILEYIPLPPLPSVNLTLPGTKWCGLGSAAADFDDLGTFNKTDLCCRAHQKCEEVIEPISSMHSLDNPTLLPRFNCGCEQKLFQCLKKIDDIPSNVFGEAYFSLMEKCFAMDYPAVECVKYTTGPLGMGKRCVMYKFDESKTKKYQWFDMPYFSMKDD